MASSFANDDGLPHPNSDDSISAYIHNTSSPYDQQQHHHHRERRHGEQPFARPPSSSSSGPSSDQDAERERRSSPSAQRQRNILKTSAPSAAESEDDVEAASGMLHLRSASVSASSSASSSQDILRHCQRHQTHDPNHVPVFFIHPDDEDDDEDHSRDHPTQTGPRDAAHLRAGAQPDAVLFSNGSSPSHHARAYPTRDDKRDSRPPPDVEESRPAPPAFVEEAPSRPSDASQDVVDPAGKKRRRRTKKEEAQVLSSIYTENAFPDSATRQHLANQLGMTTRAVSIWFQNRRQAERKRASRVTSTDTHEDSTKFHRSVSSASLASTRSTSFSKSQLQRWPSLDAFASSQDTSFGRQSPDSDDEDGVDGHDDSQAFGLAPSASQGDASLNTTISDAPDVSIEEKENLPPPEPTQVDDDSIIIHADKTPHVRPDTPRQPLKDIRDLVFGFDSLPERKAEDQENDTKARILAALARARPAPGQRTPFGRSASLNASATKSRRPSMDAVMAHAAPLDRRHPPRRSTSDFIRRMSLSTSGRGRASLDGKPSPPKKQPYIIKSLLESSHLPPAMAKLINKRDSPAHQDTQGSEPSQEANDDSEADAHQDHDDAAHQHLLAMMQSSSSGVSGSDADVQPLHRADGDEDNAEDEEITLRMAANRRAAKAQALGKESYPKSDAMSDLMSRPWARSVSGPASASGDGGQGRMLPPATLDATAGRDRAKPNLHASVSRCNLPLAHLRRHASMSAESLEPSGGTINVRVVNRKRKSAADPNGRTSKKGRSKNASAAPTPVAVSTPARPSGAKDEEEVASATPSRGLDIASPLRDVYGSGTQASESASGLSPPSSAGLPSFGTPRSTIGASGKRSFGRSISAQTPAQQHKGAYSDAGYLHHPHYPYHVGAEDARSPMHRPFGAGAFLTSTPAANQMMMSGQSHLQHQQPSTVSRRSSSMLAPSMLASADAGSGGREMTPRSLAFSLGLAQPSSGRGGSSNGPQQTPFGYGGGNGQHPHQTPFSGGSSFTSRYLSSSSRDIRALPGYVRGGAVYNSPLTKGRSVRESGMIGSNTATGVEHGRGSTAAARSGRLPFSRIASQPVASMMATPANKRAREESSGDAVEAVDKENQRMDEDRFVSPRRRKSPRKSSSSSNASMMLAPMTPHGKAMSSAVGDDSGFVDSDNRDAGATRVGSGKTQESPTRMMQQRQNDAAEVLLGLAGEGR